MNLQAWLKFFFIFTASPCFAEDYAQQILQSLEYYRKTVKDYITSEDAIIHQYIHEAISHASGTVVMDESILLGQTKQVALSLNQNLIKLDQSFEKKDELMKSINLNSYDLLLTEFFNIKHHLLQYHINLQNLKAIQAEIGKVHQFIKVFCNRIPEFMSYDYLNLDPSQYPRGPFDPQYLKIKDVMHDPVTRATFFLTLSAGIVTGFVIYVSMYGFAALVSAMGFSATTGIALTFTGPVAAIVIAAFVVAMSAAEYKKEQENLKRQREAKEAKEFVEEEIVNIQKEFSQKRCTKERFQKLAIDTCNQQLSAKDSFLNAMIQKTTENLQTIQQSHADFSSIHTELEKLRAKTDTDIKEFEEQLAQSISNEILKEHRTKIEKEYREVSYLRDFNDKIKPLRSHIFNLYARNREDCLSLAEFYGKQDIQLNDYENSGKNLFSTEQKDQNFTEIADYIKSLKTATHQLIEKCFSAKTPTIYPISEKILLGVSSR